MPTNNSKSNHRPVHSNPTRRNRVARAPYNFVPLPEKIVLVDEPLPDHDRYEENTRTGWFDCELETCSPTYVRGMVTLKYLGRVSELEEEIDRLLDAYECDSEKDLPKEKQSELKEKRIALKKERAEFYSARPESKIENLSVPMIPGSSLRGMIRSLVEIVGYGKMRWVNDSPKITFRAVAASREDPLAEPYRNLIGAFSRNVLAGYWKKTDEGGWEIHPALKPQALGLPERAAYLKVKEAAIPGGEIESFTRFNDKNYWPEWYPVSFSASIGRGKTGPYVRIEQIGDEEADYQHIGTLVCTGNMLENLDENRQSKRRNQVIKSPRHNHALVLEEDQKAKRLPVSKQLIDDYLDSLTPFQRDKPWKHKLLKQGGIEQDAPVFYVNGKGKVTWFGHTPNFRIPALNKKGVPATPLDFIPKEIAGNEKPDLAEAIFGWVEEKVNYKLTEQSLQKLKEKKLPDVLLAKLREVVNQQYPKKKFLAEVASKIGDEQWMKFNSEILKCAEKDNLEEQRAGRVFFSDAEFVDAKNNEVWYRTDPLAPATLGSPKITTFQHYLVQDADAGHNPDFRQTLAHYSSNPDETRIRGHKLYWHKGQVPIPEADGQNESQLTRIIPVKPGVKFKFHLHFENLHDYELGALAWALQLPGEAGKTYRHKLGMGKPLGMGAVAITTNLYVTERRDRLTGRYARLFTDGSWTSGATVDDPRRFITKFEDFVLKKHQIAPGKARLAEVPRIRMLLAMLQWREATDEWLDKTRYLSIQHPQYDNEYKDRPVLPDPLEVGGQADVLEEEERLGMISYIPPGRPFGYIKPHIIRASEEEDGIFFHFNKFKIEHKLPRENQEVGFKVRMGERGLEAYDVRLK